MGTSNSIITHKLILKQNGEALSASYNPFPTLGVKLKYIEEFYKLFGGRDKFIDMTTEDVNNQYQKKITESSKLSFCEYLQQIEHDAVYCICLSCLEK